MPQTGLSTTTANQLLATDGLNTLSDTNPTRPLKIFLAQFRSFMVAILLVGTALSFFLGDVIDALFILSVVVLNAVFGFIQEFRAEKAIKALKNLVHSQITVIRDGQKKLLDTKFLVKGDIILIEEGTKVPADCQLIEVVSLEVNESALTGESFPVVKVVDGEDDEGRIFSGTTIIKGHGKAKVIATGVHTKFGQISQLIKSIPDDPTPLQRQLNSVSKTLAVAAVFATGFIFLVGLFKGEDLFLLLLTSISLAVAVVPEGLPAVLTITLALGVQRMVRKKAIVRRLNSIETLGSTNVICTDKTGTLTLNEMTVKNIWVDFTTEKIAKEKNKKLDKLVEIATLANNATSISRIDDERLEIVGDKTEGALLNFAHYATYSVENLRSQGKLVAEFPFDSNAKTMSVLWEKESLEILSKGAPEILLEKSKFLRDSGGKVQKLTPKNRERILEDIKVFSEKGERVIGFAYKKVFKNSLTREEAEENLIFVGFVGISDPLREGIKETIQTASEAGIRTIMVTGDSSATAQAIAQEAGIIHSKQEVFTADLTSLSDVDLDEAVQKYNVFARINPVDKNRIVKALQNRGFVVAVTGDGVNDAPALKQADVGVAMAITGTDVAKETSDIVLTDDNYSTLVTAVEEGRVIYDNILKSLKFLLSSNSSELFVILASVFLGLPLPLTPIQILWTNLVTDTFPALALATDPKDPLIMKRLPRDKTQGILQLIDPYWLIKLGLVVSVVTLLVFMIFSQFLPIDQVRLITFTTLIVLQLGIAFLVRKPHKWYTNKRLLLSNGLILLFQGTILVNPTLREIFSTL